MAAPDYQTLDGLQKHPLFHLLTSGQQVFLVAYIENGGDRVAAASKAFKTENPDKRATRAMQSSYLRKLIALFYGFEADQGPMNKTELLGLIAARLRKPTTGDAAFSKLVDNFVDLTVKRGGKRGRPTNEENESNAEDAEPNIDELVKQAEAQKKG
ncbi:MAG: hypothetical protein WAU89_13450 [Candidatus Acidiferrales bacterium]